MKTNYSFSRNELSRFMMKEIIEAGLIKGDGTVTAEFTIDPDNEEEFATVTVSHSDDHCPECEEAIAKGTSPFDAILNDIINDILSKRPKAKGN